jgi:hypothetical protein
VESKDNKIRKLISESILKMTKDTEYYNFCEDKVKNDKEIYLATDHSFICNNKILKNLLDTFPTLPENFYDHIASKFIMGMILKYHSYPKVSMKSFFKKKHGNRR